VPVAAIDLHLAGIEPEALSWNTETMGFATATAAQADGTHAIIYSMMPRQIEEGRTVLATFDADRHEATPCHVVLCDSKARHISVGYGVTTGIRDTKNEVRDTWTLTDLSGKRLASGTRAAEADIIKQAERRQLHGVFILNMNGAKHKIVIK
jgi:hypothetical protein